MKKILLFAAVITMYVYPQTQTALFERANESYQERRFEDAARDYEKIIEMGYVSAVVFYNLGNSYYRTGHLGLAILNYEKAYQLEPSDEDIVHNLKLASREIIDEVEPLPELFLFRWWDEAVLMNSINGWTMTAVFFYVVFIVLLGYFLLTKNPKTKRISFFTGIPVLVLLVLTLSLLYSRINKDLNLKHGVIIEYQTQVKTSPDEDGTDVFLIHEGLKVEIVDYIDDWYKIRLADGKVGWIENDVIGVI